MDIVIIIGIATLIYTLVGFGYNIIDYCIDRQKKKDYEKLDNHEDYIIGGHIDYNNNMNRQTVYKVDGDFNGDIKGDNVTVILMGNGNFNGDISSKDGEVVLIKGSINGDVKANKIVCPTEPTTKDKDQYICKEEYDGTPPEEIIEYVHNRKLAVKYATCPIVHMKCPNCGKHFAKQLRVQTTVLDGVIVGTNVEEIRHDY